MNIKSKNMFDKINKFIAKYSYTDDIKQALLKIDASANINAKDINNFLHKKDNLRIKTYFPYILEKFIVYTTENGKKSIESNATIKIYNMCNKIYDNDLTYEKLAFLGDKEQGRFQDKNYNILKYRYTQLFANDITSEKIIQSIFKMDLEKFVTIYLAFALFIYNFEKVEIYLNVDKFKKFTINQNTDFCEQNIDDFLEYISISKENFKDKYNSLRTQNAIIASNTKLSKIDKVLPKASFFYPLIRDKEKYYFSSYTAVFEFLRLEKVFCDISENKSINKHYRSDILGKELIENYVRQQAKIFAKKDKYTKVYGGEKYEVKNKKYNAPDVIFEASNYMIMIECKNSFSNLINTIHDFSDIVKRRISEDLKKSKKNVDRYLKYKQINNDKKIYKFLMYFNATPVSTKALEFGLFDNVNFTLTDISSIELLFRIKLNSLDEFINNFKKQPYSLHDFIKKSSYKIDTSDIDNQTISKKYFNFQNDKK